MNSITAMALAGLQSARQRFDAASKNIAKAATAGALPSAEGAAASAPAVSVDVRSGADAAASVDPVGEIVNQKAALQAYRASARLVRVGDQLDQAVLDATGTTPRRSVHA
jgi:flagellar basal body rod protein FlgC